MTGTELAETAAAPRHARMGRWRVWRLRNARRKEVLSVLGLLALASVVVWTGNRAALHLSPLNAVGMARALDTLEVPGWLPDAPLVNEDGGSGRLWEITNQPRTLVTFYAPWCGPCQEELPKLVAGTRPRGNLIVVLGSDEDLHDARRQLENIGLRDLRLWIDRTGALTRKARVTSLPSTLLIGRKGKVQARVVGYSGLRLEMLIAQAGRVDE
jgi:thiol-disulfide isomerase/thioredoxin